MVTEERRKTIYTAVSTIVGVLGIVWAIGSYSMDWQREQDEKIADLDKLLVKQQEILKYQIQINENAIRSNSMYIQPRIPYEHAFEGYETPLEITPTD